MAELCVDLSSCFLPGSLSTLALLGGGCNFQLLWIAKLWGREYLEATVLFIFFFLYSTFAILSSVTTELAVAAFLGSLGSISAGFIAESFFGGGCNFQLLWIAKLWGRAVSTLQVIQQSTSLDLGWEGLCCVITIFAESFFGWFAGAFHSLVDVLLSQRGLLAALWLANHVLAFGSGRMAELCVDLSSCFLPGSLSTLALLGGGCNFQLLWIAKLWGRAVSTLQVIQQSTSLDLGWEGNSPIIWEPIDFLRELSDINLRTKEEGRNNGEALLSPLQILATVSSEKAIANLEKNKVIYLSGSVHFGQTFLTSPHLSSLSFPPPLQETAVATSTNKASNLH
ncbi:hypothetical protein POTOM_011416 [Populus tomentosa]|uniref:Uncharacterized protein n=1 Tax=Populus tomentosa TaxID=118781 RepID=A0A8X8DAH2_POPTO|nr:hypothetical protein POTOM_011416 [Populus tomentosa]